MDAPGAVPVRGRGESGWSEKGENADNSGFVEGLSPRGACTAIISTCGYGLRHTRPRLRGRSAPSGRVASFS